MSIPGNRMKIKCAAVFPTRIIQFMKSANPLIIENNSKFLLAPIGKRAVVQRLNLPGRETCHLTHVPLYDRNAG